MQEPRAIWIYKGSRDPPTPPGEYDSRPKGSQSCHTSPKHTESFEKHTIVVTSVALAYF